MIARWLSAGGRVRVAALAVLAMAGGACDRMPLTAPTKSTIQIFSTAPTVPLNGTVDVVASVTEEAGTPVQNGTLVTFTATLGHLEPAEARTENGRVTVKFVAGNQSGTATVTALSGGATSGGTDTSTLGAKLDLTVGGAAADSIAVRAEPAVVPRTGGTVTITAQVRDASGNALAGVPVSFSTTAGTLQSTSVTTGSNGEASTTLTTTGKAVVTARAGAKSADITVDVVALPTITLQADPPSPIKGQPVVFSVTIDASTSTNPVRSVRIEFGDGDFEDLGSVAGSTSVSHVYSHDGGFTVKVTVTDTAGQQASQVFGISVLPQPLITVNLTYSPPNSPTEPVHGEVITFDAGVTLGIGVTAEYDWAFGDGASRTTTSESTTKIYAAAGTYHVTVTVHASDGSTGSAAADINVK
jgi:PKD repeat protein